MRNGGQKTAVRIRVKAVRVVIDLGSGRLRLRNCLGFRQYQSTHLTSLYHNKQLFFNDNVGPTAHALYPPVEGEEGVSQPHRPALEHRTVICTQVVLLLLLILIILFLLLLVLVPLSVLQMAVLTASVAALSVGPIEKKLNYYYFEKYICERVTNSKI